VAKDHRLGAMVHSPSEWSLLADHGCITAMFVVLVTQGIIRGSC